MPFVKLRIYTDDDHIQCGWGFVDRRLIVGFLDCKDGGSVVVLRTGMGVHAADDAVTVEEKIRTADLYPAAEDDDD